MDKGTQKQGEELNQLSRLIFGRAAAFWYAAIMIELVAGILGVAVCVGRPPHDWELLLATVGFIFVAAAYYLKIRFDGSYADAETMRRQSVLTEALGWPIGKTQFSEWRLRAGRGILRKFEVESRDPDYYETQAKIGPKRLLDMTVESAFYTRHLYVKARRAIWLTFSVVTIGFIILMSLSTLPALPERSSFWVAYTILLLLPVVLSIDLLSWGVQLNRLIYFLCKIEEGLERIEDDGEVELAQIMRLVSEYNCQVAKGFPVADWFFNRHHDEIKDLWNKRK